MGKLFFSLRLFVKCIGVSFYYEKEIIINTDHNFIFFLYVSEDGFCYCPVCGSIPQNKDWRPYDTNGNPSYDICSCNFQFGYDDGDYPGPYDKSWKSYREKWFNGQIEKENPPRLTLSQKKEQLKNIGIELIFGLSRKETQKLRKNKCH